MSAIGKYASPQVPLRLTTRRNKARGTITADDHEQLSRQLSPRTLGIKTDTSEDMLTIPFTYIIKSRIKSLLRR